MDQKPRQAENKHKRPYVKPKLEAMNEKARQVYAAPPVPAAAAASPVAPGATVF